MAASSFAAFAVGSVENNVGRALEEAIGAATIAAISATVTPVRLAVFSMPLTDSIVRLAVQSAAYWYVRRILDHGE